MKQETTKRHIIAKFREWVRGNGIRNPSQKDGWAFFSYLQNEHPDLLKFRYSGDPWQCVKGWLFSSQLISE